MDRSGAYLNNCSAIITYDGRFDELKQAIEVCTPEVFLARESSLCPTPGRRAWQMRGCWR